MKILLFLALVMSSNLSFGDCRYVANSDSEKVVTTPTSCNGTTFCSAKIICGEGENAIRNSDVLCRADKVDGQDRCPPAEECIKRYKATLTTATYVHTDSANFMKLKGTHKAGADMSGDLPQ